MLLAVALFFAGMDIQIIGIRNAVKAELANLSVEISEDTYKALRESNFEAYKAKLYSSSSYKRVLVNKFYENLENNIKLTTESYDIDDINLEFAEDGNKLRYTFTCEVTFHVTIFGGAFPQVTRDITIEGRHNAKY